MGCGTMEVAGLMLLSELSFGFRISGISLERTTLRSDNTTFNTVNRFNHDQTVTR